MKAIQAPEQQALLMILIATAALSLKGILAKFVYAAGTDVTVLLLLRFGLAVPLFWLWYGYSQGKAKPGRESVATMPKMRQVKQLMIASALFFSATYSDFQALVLIDAGLSRLILFTFPVFVVLINAGLTRTIPGGLQILALLLAYAGLVTVMLQGSAGDSLEDNVNQAEGIGWAMVAAMSYAVYLVYSQRVMKYMSSALFSAASGSFILLLMIVFYLLQGSPDLSYSPESVMWSALIAVLCTVLPFLLMHEAIRLASAERASRVALAGPAMTLLFAWLWLGEVLLPLQLVGCVITVAAIAWLEKLRTVSGVPAR